MGISVMYTDQVDLICGWRGRTFLFEVKSPKKLYKKDGITYRKGAIKKSQSKLMAHWQGHYAVVTSIDDILYEMDI